MSREVDLSKPLSAEDAEYLAMRGRYADLERAGGVAPEGDGTGPALTSPLSADMAAAEEERLLARLAQLNPEKYGDLSDDGDDDDGDGDPAPYHEWTVPELDAELKGRQLSTSGTKAEKVKRLEDDDAAQAES